MKATGVVRKIDELGRIVIPKEICTTLDLKPGHRIEFYVEGKFVMLAKYQEGCILCGQDDVRNLMTINSHLLCHGCVIDVSKYKNDITKEAV